MNRDCSITQSSNEMLELLMKTNFSGFKDDVNEESLEYFSAHSIAIGELVNSCQMSPTNEGNQSGFHSMLYFL